MWASWAFSAIFSLENLCTLTRDILRIYSTNGIIRIGLRTNCLPKELSSQHHTSKMSPFPCTLILQEDITSFFMPQLRIFSHSEEGSGEGEGKECKRKKHSLGRETSIGFLPGYVPTGVKLTTQVCILTQNWTHILQGLEMLQTTEPHWAGLLFFSYLCTSLVKIVFLWLNWYFFDDYHSSKIFVKCNSMHLYIWELNDEKPGPSLYHSFI